MQLNWLYFCGICQTMSLNVWPNTAIGCNHPLVCMPQLQPLCSAVLVPMYYPEWMQAWVSPVQLIEPDRILAPSRDLNQRPPGPQSRVVTSAHDQLVRSTSSSAVVTLQRLPSRLEISNRFVYFQAPVLWYALSHYLRFSTPFSSLIISNSFRFHKQPNTHLFFFSSRGSKAVCNNEVCLEKTDRPWDKICSIAPKNSRLSSWKIEIFLLIWHRICMLMAERNIPPLNLHFNFLQNFLYGAR